ncbi:DUF3108 domain-containing protein [candidate division KSB1 bacterium]|nr:DUF3108 domain-containing protein [candidate division KSB1 bacterium]
MNTLKAKFFLLTILSILFASGSYAQTDQFHWKIGEEFSYKVNWSFIRLGTITIEVHDTLRINNNFVYHIQLHIDSNPVLFWVNMHSVYNSYIDEQFRVFLFMSNEDIDNVKYFAEYKFDYDKNLLNINMTSIKDPSQVIVRSEPINETLFDGAAIIYYARTNIEYAHDDTVTAFFEGERGPVSMHFKGANKKIHVDALQKSLPTYYVEGIIGLKAVAGLTGPFKGWFATDDQRPPLKAELKVFVGHVSLELENWQNWCYPSPIHQ